MQLVSFRVTNFRSINDSGEIAISRITSLVGRNESGKSNLLLALHSLNPATGFKALSPIKDFPRHRRLDECTNDTEVVKTRWLLSEEEREELADLLPRAEGITQVTVGRSYGTSRSVSFGELPAIPFDATKIKASIKKAITGIKATVSAVLPSLAPEQRGPFERATAMFEKDIAFASDRYTWASNAVSAISSLRTALATVKRDLTDKQEELISELGEKAEELAGDDDVQQEARTWIVGKLPVFMYLDEYPELHGHQNIGQFLERKNSNTMNEADRNFEKLCTVAGLSPKELQDNRNKPETRNQLANRASAIVTEEIRRLWKDRPLKTRFNLDAEYLDTFISDPNVTYDVEVNFNERSRGFRWFFSFYISFSADTDGGAAEDAILLLDEPGLYLHAKSQTDLLKHFEDDFSNQIIYTTHSPFMVPMGALDSIRTVNVAEKEGTTVTNDPTGDPRTLFPIQAALGYDLAQSLFIGTNNLVVEGVTDFWIASSISDYLQDIGKTALDERLTINPAGGAQKVSYMVALLTSQNLNVLVLLDSEKNAEATRDQLVKDKLIREQNVVFIAEGFAAGGPVEADVEDLLDAEVYEALVQECYAKELTGKTLTLNANVPRIVKRMEVAFTDLGLEFKKTRPARLLLTKMGTEPKTIVTVEVAERFGQLFSVINARFQKHLQRGAKPFR